MDRYHDKYNEFYNSKEWKELRKQKMIDSEFLCQDCLAKGIVMKAKEVHHIIPIDQCWEKRLDYDNLICLCKDCHNLKHKSRTSAMQEFKQFWEKL